MRMVYSDLCFHVVEFTVKRRGWEGLYFKGGVEAGWYGGMNVIIPSFLWRYSQNLALASSFEFFLITHNETHGRTPWTNDQPVAEASTYTEQHNI
jgi:hypothetical protein